MIAVRYSYAKTQPELVREARRLYRRSPVTGQRRSLREVAAELARLGYVNGRGGRRGRPETKRGA